MYDIFDTWSRLVSSSMSMGRTGMQAAETLTAAQKVVAVRAPMINAALLSPLTGNHAELSKMVPEKVEAFSRAGSAVIDALWASHGTWMDHMLHLGAMASRGRVPTLAEVSNLGERTAALALEAVEASVRLGAATLAPVHGKATANARRLASAPGRRRRTRP